MLVLQKLQIKYLDWIAFTTRAEQAVNSTA